MTSSRWLRIDSDAVIVQVHAQPGAKRSECAGLHGDALKIRLAAPPVDGKANLELQRFLAAALGLGVGAVRLISGQSARTKRVAIACDDPSAVAAMLQAWVTTA